MLSSNSILSPNKIAFSLLSLTVIGVWVEVDTTLSTSTTDISTVICPLCGIDAVVPQSIIQDNTILLKWHEMGFGNN